MLAPDCRFLGLCKANAYGHGALQVGRKLEALGADMLAVACVDEAAELRRGGVTIPILCRLSPTWRPAGPWPARHRLRDGR